MPRSAFHPMRTSEQQSLRVTKQLGLTQRSDAALSLTAAYHDHVGDLPVGLSQPSQADGSKQENDEEAYHGDDGASATVRSILFGF